MKLHKILLTLCAHYFIAQPLMAAPFAYVTNSESNNVTPINTATNVAGVNFTSPAPFGIAFTPDGKRVLVVNAPAVPGTVSIYDVLNNNALLFTVNLPEGAQRLAITPDGTLAYVSSSLRYRCFSY